MTDLAALLEGREIDVPTVGSSMWPRLKSGDVVRVAPLPADGPRVGNIVLVARDASLAARWVVRPLGGAVADTCMREPTAPGHARATCRRPRRRRRARATAVSLTWSVWNSYTRLSPVTLCLRAKLAEPHREHTFEVRAPRAATTTTQPSSPPRASTNTDYSGPSASGVVFATIGEVLGVARATAARWAARTTGRSCASTCGCSQWACSSGSRRAARRDARAVHGRRVRRALPLRVGVPRRELVRAAPPSRGAG